MLETAALLVAIAMLAGVSMSVRSMFRMTGTTRLRTASGTSIDYGYDDADGNIKYVDHNGLVQVLGRGALSKSAVSTATVSAGYAADTYLAGSGIAVPTGGFVAGARYTCTFDMVKTAAGTAQFTITLRIGTTGTVSDAAILTFAFAAGTAAVDTGTFEVFAHFRTVGSGTSAVVVGTAYCSHALAATGLISTGASGIGQITTVSSGFDSTIAGTTIGLSVNGGASFSGTNTIVETELRSF